MSLADRQVWILGEAHLSNEDDTIIWSLGWPYVVIDAVTVAGQDYPISLSPGLTASTTVAYAVAWDRGTSPSLIASATVAYLIAYKRATQAGLIVAVTVLKSWGRTITTSAGLTIAAIITRVVAYKRATPVGLTIAATISRKLAYARVITTNLTATIIAIVVARKCIIFSVYKKLIAPSFKL